MLEPRRGACVPQVHQFLLDQVFELVAGVDKVLLDGLAEPPVGGDEGHPELVALDRQPVGRGLGRVLRGGLEHRAPDGYVAEDPRGPGPLRDMFQQAFGPGRK